MSLFPIVFSFPLPPISCSPCSTLSVISRTSLYSMYKTKNIWYFPKSSILNARCNVFVFAFDTRCTSEVCYKSTCHFQERLECSPGLAVTSCSHTIIAWPGRVARHHSSVVQLEPRQRPRRHSTATIVYPKQATATFRTTLTCGWPRHATSRFTSRVHLERVNGSCFVLTSTETLENF
uniref:Refilin A n=1 Tax=Eptatretus burgeri TaxID=7764 RepID=A0A8C4NN79_EPTBU